MCIDLKKLDRMLSFTLYLLTAAPRCPRLLLKVQAGVAHTYFFMLSFHTCCNTPFLIFCFFIYFVSVRSRQNWPNVGLISSPVCSRLDIRGNAAKMSLFLVPSELRVRQQLIEKITIVKHRGDGIVYNLCDSDNEWISMGTALVAFKL